MKKQLKAGQFQLAGWQIKKIIDNEPDFRNRQIIRLAAHGLRRQEISDLQIDMLDGEKNRLFVIGKRKKLRCVPVERSLLNDLFFLVGKRKTGHVFPAKIAHDKGLATKQINLIISAAAKRAKVRHPDKTRGHVNPHLFRHSYAHKLKKAGVSMEAISAILGHDNINTTVKTYGILSEDDICQEITDKVFEK